MLEILVCKYLYVISTWPSFPFKYHRTNKWLPNIFVDLLFKKRKKFSLWIYFDGKMEKRGMFFFSLLFTERFFLIWFSIFLFFQHVDEENAYMCGYLKIKNLTDEYPEMVTFFDGEIISEKHPFLTRKWDADEDVDKRHWVSLIVLL